MGHHTEIPDPALTAAIEPKYTTDDVFVVVRFGDAEVARWNVTDRRAEFEEQPGDYWSTEDRARHEREWVSVYVGSRLSDIFRGA